MQRRAFTLIELLIVISILSLLVAILLPALSKAKTIARSAICQSNLRQLAIWGTTYASEWNDVLPTRGGADGQTQTWWWLSRTGWSEKIPYRENSNKWEDNALQCPALAARLESCFCYDRAF